MRKVIFSLVLIMFLFLQACVDSDLGNSRKIMGVVVAAPPLGYLSGEVSGANWLSTAGNQQNLQLSFSKALATDSVDAECSYLIDWATALGATTFRDGQADGNIPLLLLSGNEYQAQQTCVEVLSLVKMDPDVESGSAVWQMFGNYQSNGTSIGDFGLDINHSYDQEPDTTELTHNMNMSFFTMLGVTQ